MTDAVHPAEAALAAAWPIALDPAQYERAVRVGLAGRETGPRVGRVEFESVIMDGQRFRLAQHCEDQRGAEVAFLFPAYDDEEEIADVVAWVPETGKMATLLGEIGTLGLWHLLEPRVLPLPVYSGLLEWWLRDEAGVFILDDKLAAAELDGVTLAAPDRAAALRLHRRLAPHVKRAPNIVAPKVAA